ncbi:MAG: hypothetical protein K2I77_06010, partial [Anaeroplasmataceae bacterium]|nr:hypothetical protein [Anaeroplasmataceae bacterium]
VNDYVAANEAVAHLYANFENVDEVIKMVKDAYQIGKNETESQLILKIIH